MNSSILLLLIVVAILIANRKKDKYMSPSLRDLQSAVNVGSLTNDYVETHPNFGRVTFPFYDVSPEDWEPNNTVPHRDSYLTVGARGPAFRGIPHI
jgi:hypothetical protein